MLRPTLCLSALACIALAPLQAQDECSTAATIVLGAPLPFDTSSATASVTPWDCGLQTNPRPDVWFRFTPPSAGTFRVDTCGPANFLAVYEGACGGLVAVGCDDLRCRIENSFSRGGAVIFAGAATSTYYFRVSPPPLSSLPASGGIRVDTHAAPSNDECAGARPIVANSSTPFDTFGATRSPEPGGCASSIAGDLWYSFTPVVSGTHRASTCGSTPVTSLQIYQGPCSSLASSVCSSSACSGFRGADALFSAVAGTTYLLRVFGEGPLGDGTLTLVRVGSAPNDECGGALPIVLGVATLFDTSTGTASAPAWGCAQANGPDLWYEFVAPTTGLYTAWDIFTAYTSAVEVFAGPCGGLTSIGCDSGSLGAGQSRADFAGVAGVRYLVRVGGVANGAGQGDLRIFERPVNDDCVRAAPLTLATPVVFENSTASAGPEPWGCGPPFQERDVWYSFTPSANAPYAATTCGTPFAPRVEVYSGACGALARIACTVDTTCFVTAARFFGTAGTTYLLRVGGIGTGGPSGVFEVTLDPTPGNDTCANALPIHTGTFGFDTTAAAIEPGNWFCNGSTFGGPDVFFAFTPVVSGRYRASTCGSSFGAIVSVHTGACGMAASLSCSVPICGASGPGGTTFFDAVAGVRYLLRVHGFGAAGPGLLTLDMQAPPANDGCGGATPIVAGSTPFDSAFATSSAPQAACGAAPGADVWFRYVAPVAGLVDVELCGSDFQTVVEVFRGASCGSLTPVGCNAFSGFCAVPSLSRAALGFAAQAGEVFHVRVSGQFDQAAHGVLTLVDGIDPSQLPARYCSATANSTGAPALLSASGNTSLFANQLTLMTDGLPLNRLGYYLVARTQGATPNAGGSAGTLCLGGAIGRYSNAVQSSGGTGEIDLALDFLAVPQPLGFVVAMRGETWNWQLWYRDDLGGVSGSNFSNGLSATLQ